MAETKFREGGLVDVTEDAGSQPPVEQTRQHLNPAPSNDPADPLNWPMALKVRPAPSKWRRNSTDSLLSAASWPKSVFLPRSEL